MKLHPGDMILQNAWSKNKLVNWIFEMQDKIDGGEANHALIFLEGNTFLESNFPGVRFITLNKIQSDPNYCVRRYVGNMDKLKMKETIREYARTHKMGYSWLGLINASIGAITGKIFGKKLRLLPESPRPYCMELVAEIYEKYGIHFIIHNDIITPNDGMRSKQFKTIKKFG